MTAATKLAAVAVLLMFVAIIGTAHAQQVEDDVLPTVAPASSSSGAACPGAITASCPLAPYQDQLTLQDQVFCPQPGTATGLEMQGTGCASLQYCCAAYDSLASSPAFSVVGAGININPTTGDAVVPVGSTVRIEFTAVTCVAQIALTTNGVVSQGSVLVTRYYVPGGAASDTSSVDAPLNPDGSTSMVTVDSCNLVAISFTAPVDAAIYIQSISLCLLNTQLDSCGVCNGDGSSCDAAASDNDSSNNNNGPDVAEEVLTASYHHHGPSNPVIPTIYCHKNKGDKCCTVWGYEFHSYKPTYIPAGSPHNYFLPVAPDQDQPSLFLPGGEQKAVEVYWNCTEHIKIHLKWQVDTWTDRPVRLWPVGLQVHRLDHQSCPSDLCTFEPT